ncbi:MAG: AraC family transcriptional regulator [Pseudomonadales bacterium]|nr:AraC family transcriptional regulator [Halioglobus sp.]MCP5193794.1 AraC family transcriptional regulator [Pseudomonadales bacterium]
MQPEIPLSKHRLLRDGDLRETVDIGSTLFWRNDCQTEEVDKSLGAQFNGINLGDMTIAYLTFDSRVSIAPAEESQHLLVQSTLKGNGNTRNGRQSFNTMPNDIAVIDPSLPTRITFEPGCAHLVLKVTRRLIEGKLSELLRRQINDDLVFDVISPRGNTSHHAWFETMKYLCTFYDMPDQLLQSNRHVLQSQLDLTSCTLLTALKHNFSDRLADSRLVASPRHVRRACEYIESNIKFPISMGELCQVTDVTERTLQHGFKKHLGQTPSAFIRSRRLHHIHQALLSAEAHTNVSRVMWEYGVSNPGLWAKLYFRQYGCHPSATLNSRIN